MKRGISKEILVILAILFGVVIYISVGQIINKKERNETKEGSIGIHLNKENVRTEENLSEIKSKFKEETEEFVPSEEYIKQQQYSNQQIPWEKEVLSKFKIFLSENQQYYYELMEKDQINWQTDTERFNKNKDFIDYMNLKLEDYVKQMQLTDISLKKDPRSLRFDLNLHKIILDIAMEKEDMTAIEYAYKVFNDLNIDFNDQEETKFKVSAYARGQQTGSIHLVDVIDYIEQNSTYVIQDGQISNKDTK